MNKWRVLVTYTEVRPLQTRESRLALPVATPPAYGTSESFDTEEEAVKYAVMSRLAGHEVYITGPDEWLTRWFNREEKNDGQED